MKNRSMSMFSRIMAVVLGAILLLTITCSTLCWLTVRNQQINTKLEELKKEARDIAWLASQTGSDPWQSMMGGDTTKSFMRRKVSRLSDEYGANIIVADRTGSTFAQFREVIPAGVDKREFLRKSEEYAAFQRVLAGEEISVRTNVNGNPTFTVGVPFMQHEVIQGAVLIQTKAQQVEGNLWSWLWPMLLSALGAALLASVLMWVYLHSVLKPLREVTQAAKAMAGGDFGIRVETGSGSPETRELSRAFNTMADKLSDTETSRREFVANVSHELRSPVTSISGYVEGMRDGTIPPEEHEKYLAVVGDETRRLSKLIGALLALSRLEKDTAVLNITDFDMCELLRRAIIRRMGDLDEKGIDIDCQFRLEPCMVSADQDRIDQVLVNLLDNAIKFTPSGGRITLCTDRESDHVVVRVQDNGVGILPEDRSRVFERFFTADRAHTSGKGTGLGLAISQRIMEMHGQVIRLEDSREGACFAITLAVGKENK